MAQQPAIIRRKRVDCNVGIIQKVAEMLKTLDHGSVTLIIQKGEVFQINKTESRRIGISDSE